MDVKLMYVQIGRAHVVLFDTDAKSRTKHDRQQLLVRLTDRARVAGLRVDRSALVFTENNRQMTFGDRDLVTYLNRNRFALRWTHTIGL